MSPDILAPLRRLRLVALAVVPVVAALVLSSADTDSTVPDGLPVALAALTGLAAVGGAIAAERTLLRQRPDAADARGAVRAQHYLQLAIAEFPLVLSVGLAYALGPGWVALVGATTAIAALIVGWPSTARARRLEAHWGLPAGALQTAAPAGDDAEDDEDASR